MAVIYGTLGPDIKNGTSGNDTLYGWLMGGNASSPSGNDILYGKAGNDRLYGGTDNDKLFGDGGSDSLYGGKGNDYLSGGCGNDKLYGEAGNDILSGGLGSDALFGGTGNDTYIVDRTTDTITEYFNEGVGYDDYGNPIAIDLDTDEVKSSISWTLGKNLENLTLTGTNAISGTGNALNNSITGNAANNSLYGKEGSDTLNGGSGSDTLFGGTGNDTYFVDSSTDTIVEDFNKGFDYETGEIIDLDYDTVNSSVSYKLSSNLEHLILTGSSNISGTGNTSNNSITGNNSNNTLYGNAGDDILSGGKGKDTLHGGAGNDSYIFDGTDTIIESSNQGVDTVGTFVSHKLGANVENLFLAYEAGAINGTGNASNNTIEGNNASNYLNGDAGNDVLGDSEYYDHDTLVGGAGNDSLSDVINGTLKGGAGDDTLHTDYGGSLIGGTGNDTYIVDSTTDIIVEDFNAGVDTIKATFVNTLGDNLSYTLGNNLENLILDNYHGPVSGKGNTLNNIISIEGGYGDINDYLFGDAGNDYLTSSGGSDTLDGGTGNDTLTSGYLYTSDIFTGGAGADVFRFDSPEMGIDTITDFSVAADTIHVSADPDYGFSGGLTPGAPITAAQFRIGSRAADTSDRFIYDKFGTGALFFDADGTGTAGKVQFAVLDPGLSMTSNDIFVIA